MIDNLEIAERSEVGGTSVLRARAEKANWARNDARDQELVVCHGRSPFFIRIDRDVWDFQAFAPVVRPVAPFPFRLDGLLDVPFERLVPVFSASFDLLEIGVRVALDMLLSVQSRHLGC